MTAQLAAEPGDFAWEIRPHSFSRNGSIVWEPVHPYDRIPYNLFASGFRTFRVSPGVTLEEVHALMDLLRRDPSRDFAPEDDLATAFWEKQLEHVGYDVVDSFLAVGAIDDDDESETEFERLMSDARGEVAAPDGEASGRDTRDSGVKRRTSASERLSLEAHATALAARASALRAARSSGALALTERARQALAGRARSTGRRVGAALRGRAGRGSRGRGNPRPARAGHPSRCGPASSTAHRVRRSAATSGCSRVSAMPRLKTEPEPRSSAA